MASYENLGNHEVLGHAPGETFEAELDTVAEARLVGGGHIKRVTASDSSSSVASSSSPRSGRIADVRNVGSPALQPDGDAATPDADDDVAA